MIASRRNALLLSVSVSSLLFAQFVCSENAAAEHPFKIDTSRVSNSTGSDLATSNSSLSNSTGSDTQRIGFLKADATKSDSPKNESPKSDATSFDSLSELFVHESLARAPHLASEAGYHVHKDERTGEIVELDALLDDLSLERVYDDVVFYKSFKERFEKETPRESLAPQDVADFDLILANIDLYLLEMEKIQEYRHNPTGVVELIGSAIFQPMFGSYAPPERRLGHCLSRLEEVPRALRQVRSYLDSSNKVSIETAISENKGNIELIQKTLSSEVSKYPELKEKFDSIAPEVVASLEDFNTWLAEDLAKRPNPQSWRLGRSLYEEKFRLSMGSSLSLEKLLADAEKELLSVRAEMFELASSMHKRSFRNCHHNQLSGRELENKIISEVLSKISEAHPHRDSLVASVAANLEEITRFIKEKQLVTLSPRSNLKVIATPPFMRGIYSVAGFHSAPPLEPSARAEYWVTPIDPSTSEEKAESKLQEYNDFTLRWLTIHEALPGHYTQFEHLNDLQPARRRLIRSLYGNGAYIEGWAEYIAQVMMDEGFMKNDPRFRLVMRKIRLRLLANTILDIKMHTQNLSDEDAMKLMMEDAFQTSAEAEGKLARAKLSSCQLPTYYVGLKQWQRFRKRTEAREGRAFELKSFHDKALDVGPVPVSVAERLLYPRAQ